MLSSIRSWKNKACETAVKDIPGIDIFKFIMAFAVILIHFPPVFDIGHEIYPEVIRWLIRLAVPFFFIVSGYFAYKIINSPDKLRVRGMKMLRIWAIWMLIYFPLQLYSGFSDAKSVVVYIINVLLYGEEAYAWPLWFLYAQAIFFLIESFLPNRQRLRAFVHIIYICALAASSLYLLHSDLFPKLFTYTPQRAFGGCGFILCGYYLKKYEANIKINRYIFAALLLCLSYVLRVLTMPLWELTGGLALIIIALAIKCKPRPTFLTMRHESAWIYYMHMYVLMLLSLVIFTNGASKGIIISCAFVISFALAWLLTKLQKRSRMFSYLVS